jgi:hypothetical protein
LEDCYPFEFYITDSERTFLICVNHEEFIVAAGAAASWLKALPLAAPNPDGTPAGTWDYRPSTVLAALGVQSSKAGGEIYRALYMPSFHPEVCITVMFGEGTGTITMTSFDTSLWYYLLKREDRHQGSGTETPVPQRWETMGELSARRAARFRDIMLETEERLSSGTPASMGLDGMPVLGELSRAGRSSRFKDWSPKPGTPFHAFFAVFHDLASEALRDTRSQLRLEQLYGYLGLGLPVKDLGGLPRHVRFFGSLSTDYRAALIEFLRGLPPDEPMLIDMTNFESMGTGLYPDFQPLCARAGRTAWVATKEARHHLLGMRVPASVIFDDFTPAVAALGG